MSKIMRHVTRSTEHTTINMRHKTQNTKHKLSRDMCYVPHDSHCVSREVGFTLIELLLTLGIVIILTVGAILIIDPVSQFAKGRNATRKSNLQMILGAVGQNIFDNKGTFSCSSGAIPTTTTKMASSSGNYNIGPCLVPTYLQNLPVDPSTSGAKYVNETNYDTVYNIIRNASTGRVTVSAPAAELGESISYTR